MSDRTPKSLSHLRDVLNHLNYSTTQCVYCNWVDGSSIVKWDMCHKCSKSICHSCCLISNKCRKCNKSICDDCFHSSTDKLCDTCFESNDHTK